MEAGQVFYETVIKQVNGVTPVTTTYRPSNVQSVYTSNAQIDIGNLYAKTLIQGDNSSLFFTVKFTPDNSGGKICAFDVFIKEASQLIKSFKVSAGGKSLDDIHNFVEISHIKHLNTPDIAHDIRDDYLTDIDIATGGIGLNQGGYVDLNTANNPYVNNGWEVTYSIPLDFCSDLFTKYNTPMFLLINKNIRFDIVINGDYKLNVYNYNNRLDNGFDVNASNGRRDDLRLNQSITNGWSIVDMGIRLVTTDLKEDISDLITSLPNLDFNTTEWACETTPNQRLTSDTRASIKTTINSSSGYSDLKKIFVTFKPTTVNLEAGYYDAEARGYSRTIIPYERYSYPGHVYGGEPGLTQTSVQTIVKHSHHMQSDDLRYKPSFRIQVGTDYLPAEGPVWRSSDLYSQMKDAMGYVTSSDVNPSRFMQAASNFGSSFLSDQVEPTATSVDTFIAYGPAHNNLTSVAKARVIDSVLDGFQSGNFVFGVNLASFPLLGANTGVNLSAKTTNLRLIITSPTENCIGTHENYDVNFITQAKRVYHINKGHVTTTV